ncbi:MAG: hypothetical protein K8I03_08260 [Ignavibacteria bacterium]|nr:hypothetical protein [Ignavibacteria bacterium]
MKKLSILAVLLIISVLTLFIDGCRQEEPLTNPIDTVTNPVDTTRIFSKTFGSNLSDLVTGVRQAGDGGIVMCGYTIASAFGDNDIFIMKLDAAGNLIWSKLLGGSGNDQATYLERTADGGFIIGGHSNSYSGTFDPIAIKIDAAGNVMWTKYYRWWNQDYSNCIIQTSDGGYIMTGYSDSYGSGGYDIYSLKLDQTGGIMWVRCYGGSANDIGNAIRETPDAGYIIGGYTFSFGSLGDGYIIKLYGDGAVRWSKTYGGTGLDNIKDIQNSSNGFIACGSTVSFGLIDEDAYVFNIDNQDGFVYWTRTFDGTAGGNSGFTKVFQTSDGGFILGGSMQNLAENQLDMALVKLYGDGVFNFAKSFGGVSIDAATALSIKNDGGFLLSGTTTSFGAGSNDVYLQSLFSDGTGCTTDNPFTPNAGSPLTEVGLPATIYLDINFFETNSIDITSAAFNVLPNSQCIIAIP